MKKINKLLVSFFTITSVFFASLGFGGKGVLKTSADSCETYPRNGQSGTIMLVNGNSTYFNTGEADLAIYCFNSESDNAWSERSNYRVSGDLIRMMIPYQNGVSKTWSKFIICRYNPGLDPLTSGWSGVYNQSDDLLFSEFLYAQNTISVTGYNNNKLTVSSSRIATDYYGIKAEGHAYLDLSHYTDWEQGDAKFALYFSCPNSTDESKWGQAYSGEGYYSSFCWKVLGQDNDHLYECVIPNIYISGYNLWNLVIAVRFDPVAAEPGWNNVWNQTQNLSFNSSNHTQNLIQINGWNSGQLVSSISKADRLNFYGQYFLDTVSCSGHGNSDATTSAQWNSVKADYTHLSRLYRGDIWTTTADESGSLIAQAMARYDYIVLYKQYGHEDFINRAESPNKTTYSSRFAIFNSISIDKNNSLLIVIIVACITSIAAILYFALKKKARR